MKKIIAVVLIFCMLLLCSCGSSIMDESEEKDGSKPSMFVVIEEGISYHVVYHRATKVMYIMSYSSYNRGNFTLMVDENGDPLLWEGD